MDYKNSFKNRAHSYLSAMKQFPDALKEEFLTAIRMLQLRKGDVLLNIPAGGVPIDKYIYPELDITYIPFDTHPNFAHSNITLCRWNAIPVETNSVDKIICLASLHHLSPEERSSAYKEFYRILKPDGKLVIGDVIAGSNQAIWLNSFVDRHNSNGHRGEFFNESDANLIRSSGFNVETSRHSYNWSFHSRADATLFCKLLFGLDLLDITNPLLSTGLTDILRCNGTDIAWELIYFSCSPQ
jgi:SAM-dependent methyltransferase